MMNLEEIFNQTNIIRLSFFNFRNAITACYFADRDLRILEVNDNFSSFFPVLGNVSNVYLPHVLKQLGVAETYIESFQHQLEDTGRVLIPSIPLTIDGDERVFSLMSTYTQDPTFSYLNGVQGQFVDRTEEWNLRRQQEKLVEERLRDREVIEAKTRQLESLANRLAKYLSPQIYNSIFAGSSEGAETLARKNLTIFFSDIEGFTEISDGMEPERLAFVINTYLSEMTAIAIEYGGTIDKFIGDAMLIFFGDPETGGDRDDALRCTHMALRMRERVRELKSVWQENGISKPVRVRMGIMTGYCTVGNFGSEHRLDYTVLGGPVNLAARLQAAAEPDTILIGDSTFLLIRDVADTTPMGEVTLKGFMRPVSCYRLNGLGDSDAVEEALTKVGRHVAVSIPDRRRIREAIEELRRIEEDLASYVPGE